MKVSKRLFAFSFFLIGIIFTQNTFGVLADVTSVATQDFSFNIADGFGMIDCEVFQHNTTGEYIYTYQITNQQSSVGFSFFSVDIGESLSAYGPSAYINSLSDVEPIFETTSGSPVQSVNYLFSDTIDTGQTSATLFFISDDVPGLGDATLFGSNISATGNVLAPVPEPSTITLLGSAGLWILKRKKKVA